MINTLDVDGGAARAAYRLNMGLNSIGVKSQLFVQRKRIEDPNVIGPQDKLSKGVNILRPHLDNLPLMFYKYRKNFPWSIGWLPNKLLNNIKDLDPDIIHLHWIGGGFIPISILNKFNKPIVWTLHDSWAFTGGCHIPFDCLRYQSNCGSCQQLGSSYKKDLSYWMLKKKRFYLNGLTSFTVVTPSNWLAQCARSSSLLGNCDIKVIPNGINTKLYKPINKEEARSILGLPKNKKFILFGAMDSTSDINKGYQFLKPAIQKLCSANLSEKIELLIFGATSPSVQENLGFKANYLGRIYDDVTLTLIYSAADVFIAPSMQENLPNTIMEAMACGTPTVAFDVGGIPDLIEHQVHGYLAKPFSTEDLSLGLSWVLENDVRLNTISINCRKKVINKFDLKIVSKKYLDLYQEILT